MTVTGDGWRYVTLANSVGEPISKSTSSHLWMSGSVCGWLLEYGHPGGSVYVCVLTRVRV